MKTLRDYVTYRKITKNRTELHITLGFILKTKHHLLQISKLKVILSFSFSFHRYQRFGGVH